MSNLPQHPGIIDVHSHIYPQCYLDHLLKRDQIPKITRRGDQLLFAIFPQENDIPGGGGRPIQPDFFEIEQKLAYMDRHKIEQTVISLGNPWVNPMPDENGNTLAHEVNCVLATYPVISADRIFGMGVLPASSLEKAQEELQFIASAPSLKGVSCGPQIAGLALDDPRLDALWADLSRLNIPVFIHPENGLAVQDLQGYHYALLIGIAFPLETTATLARLILSGVLERFPKLRIMAAHGGGTLPFLAGRLDTIWKSEPALQESLPHKPSDYMRKLYFDALVYNAAALQAVTRLAGPGRVMFGSDHPFSVADPQTNIEAVMEEYGNSPVANGIFHQNAREFFGI